MACPCPCTTTTRHAIVDLHGSTFRSRSLLPPTARLPHPRALWPVHCDRWHHLRQQQRQQKSPFLVSGWFGPAAHRRAPTTSAASSNFSASSPPSCSSPPSSSAFLSSVTAVVYPLASDATRSSSRPCPRRWVVRAVTTPSSSGGAAAASPPSESRGAVQQRGNGCTAVESRYWHWRENVVVHYAVAGHLNDSSAPAVLLLPGFGVGTFHWQKQLEGLGADHRVWALDFLGQGKSWPTRDPAPDPAAAAAAAAEARTVSPLPSLYSSHAATVVEDVSHHTLQLVARPVLATGTTAAAATTTPAADSATAASGASPTVGAAEALPAIETAGLQTASAAAAAAAAGATVPVPAPTDGWGFGSEAEEWAQELVYSVDMWMEQVTMFVQQVVGEPVLIAGNSLGGYVGTYVAAQHPSLVRGLVLLNVTPFWAFAPNPVRQPLLSSLWPWSGRLPVPAPVRALTRQWWDALRSPSNIRRLLSLVYARKDTIDEQLVRDIVQPTDHPAAAAAFASIVFAPKAAKSFEENIARLRELGMDVCMVYGREDPWVVPLWGMRLKKALPNAVYYELSPCGHCPHHEAPQVVNHIIRGWVAYITSPTPVALPLFEHMDVNSDSGMLNSSSNGGGNAGVDGRNVTPWREWLAEEAAFAPVASPVDGGAVGGRSAGKRVVRARVVMGLPEAPVPFLRAAVSTMLETVRGAY